MKWIVECLKVFVGIAVVVDLSEGGVGARTFHALAITRVQQTVGARNDQRLQRVDKKV